MKMSGYVSSQAYITGAPALVCSNPPPQTWVAGGTTPATTVMCARSMHATIVDPQVRSPLCQNLVGVARQ